MAAVTREYIDEQGRALREYDNGNVTDQRTGRLVAGTHKPVFTPDNARDYVARRQAKAQAAMRQRIIEATEASGLPGTGGLPISAKSSADALGIAAGVLWEQGVLNPDARLIDRVKAFDTIGKASGLLADPKQAANSVTPQQAAEIGASAAVLAMAYAELQRRKSQE